MAAFDFPSPPVEDGFEVKNELTGITYKYDAASGSWVVVASNVQDNYYTKPEVDDLLQSVSPDLIWENTNPPLPDTPYKLWYNTDTLELYFYYCDTNGVCAWTPTSVPLTALEVITNELNTTNAMVASVERLASANFSELQQIQANLGQVTLEEVLTNGNIADKGIELTDGTDDLIVVSPEEALIGIASDLESKKPRFRLAHIDSFGYPDSHAQWEIDDDGTRNDIDLGGNIEALHVRFDDQETFTLDKTGNAVFAGKVKVASADGGDEVPTFDQVSAIAELLQLQIDQITTLFERGAWIYDDGDGVPQGTEYVLSGPQTQDNYDAQLEELAEKLNQCMEEAGEDASAKSACSRDYTDGVAALTPVGDTINTNDWNLANEITFSPTDLDGNVHSFADVKVGQLLDMACDDGSGAMVAEITGVTLGMWYEDKKLNITPLKTIGVANGKTRVKIFTLDDTVDSDKLDDYVKKTGDTMTGNLKLDSKLDVVGKATFTDAVKILPNEDSGKYTFTVYGRVEGYHDSPLLIATNNDWFRNVDDCVEYFGTSDSDESLVTKKYVEEQIKKLTAPKPANFSWKLILSSRDPEEGEMCTPNSTLSKGSSIKLSHTDYDGNTFYKRTSEIFHNSALNEPLITIWDKTDEGYRHKHTMAVRSISADANSNFLVEIGESVGAKNHNLSNGVQHWVTISGFF